MKEDEEIRLVMCQPYGGYCWGNKLILFIFKEQDHIQVHKEVP